jgi:hypothetical protein
MHCLQENEPMKMERGNEYFICTNTVYTVYCILYI